MKEYKYLGKTTIYHVLCGSDFTYYIPVTDKNENSGIIGKNYTLSMECKKRSKKEVVI